MLLLKRSSTGGRGKTKPKSMSAVLMSSMFSISGGRLLIVEKVALEAETSRSASLKSIILSALTAR